MQRTLCLEKNGFTISKLNKKIKKRFEALDYSVRFDKYTLDGEKVSLFTLDGESKYYLIIEEIENHLIISTDNEADVISLKNGYYDSIFSILEKIINGGTR